MRLLRTASAMGTCTKRPCQRPMSMAVLPAMAACTALRAMFQQYIFNFAGRHVFPTAHDHIICAAFEKQIAVFIHRSCIARRKPALLVNHRAAVFVFAAHLFAFDINFTALVCAEYLAFIVANFNRNTGQGATNGNKTTADFFIAA